MVQVGNGEMGRKDGHRIAEDQVVLPVEDAFLFFGQVGRAKKTGPLSHALFAHVGKGALDPSRIVLDKDGKSAALQLPLPHVVERVIAGARRRPRHLLPGEEVEAERGQTARAPRALEGVIDRAGAEDRVVADAHGGLAGRPAHFLSGKDFSRPDPVFESVIPVCRVEVKA